MPWGIPLVRLATGASSNKPSKRPYEAKSGGVSILSTDVFNTA